MDTKALQDALAALLRDEADDLGEALTEALACGHYGHDATTECDSLASVRTFRDDGVMTTDAGLVLTFASGAEFQLTLVRSR